MADWRNRVNLKDVLSEDESDLSVMKVCNALIPQLEVIAKQERNKSRNKLDEYFLDEFESCIEEFKWIKDCIEKENDPSEFSYESWCEALNNYLEQLYDMGDTVTLSEGRNFLNLEKFMWVG